jgi:hypothetical protein
MAIQLFLDGAARRGKTVAVLFTDIKGAFYNILPEIALGPLLAAPQRLELFGKLGMSTEAARSISDEIDLGRTALARHGVPEGWRSALADWHRGSWFMVRGSRRCILPSLGVRPGDPPADVVFAIAFAAFLKLLNAELAARGLQPTVAVAGPGIFRDSDALPDRVTVPEQTYMDDTALPIEADEAGEIFGMLENAVDAVIRVAKTFGLQVNFAPGKTEAVKGLHGRGLVAARQRLAELEVETEAGRIPVLPVHGAAGLRIVEAYKHLGRYTAGSGRMTKEVAHRCGSAAAATAGLMRRVFAARGLPVKDRAHVSQACVVSRLLHGAGTWLTLSAAQGRKVQGQYMRPLRRIAGHDALPAEGGKWPTAVETLVATGQAPVQAHIAAARLRLAARISLRGTPSVQGLAQSWTGAGWRKALTHDLLLMQVVLHKRLEGMPSPARNPAAWEALWRKYPGAWHGLVRKMVQQAADEPAAFLAALAKVSGEAEAGAEVHDEAGEDEAAVQVHPPAAADVPAAPAAAAGAVEPAEVNFACTVCDKQFASRRGLMCHGTHAHKRQRPAACFVVTSICPGCGNDYRTRLRALEHVERGSAVCRQAVPGGGLGLVPADPAVVAAADAADRNGRHQARPRGVSELAGPPALVRRGAAVPGPVGL